jgi:DNA polymerase elongation subunit (family B)
LLKRLKALRNAAKKKMRAMDECPEKDRLNAKQQAYKILINSFYGALAFSYFIFNDGEEAGKVTRKGRKLLKRMMHEIEAVGGSVVLCDTDGVLFQLPLDDMPDERVDRMIGEYIDGQMPEGVEIDNDGRFEKVFAYKRKNYALVKPDGSLKINGNSLMGRGMEEIFRDYIEDQIGALLDRDVQKAYKLHEQYKEEICGGAGVARLVKRARVRMSLDEYKEKKVHGDENQLPQYEAAIRAEELHDQPSLKGDVFWYYISGTGDPSPLYQNVKLQEEYTEGDENTTHYLSRLDQIADIFRPMVSHPGQVYNMNRPDSSQGDLFSTDPDLTDATVVSERVRNLPENPSNEEIQPLV